MWCEVVATDSTRGDDIDDDIPYGDDLVSRGRFGSAVAGGEFPKVSPLMSISLVTFQRQLCENLLHVLDASGRHDDARQGCLEAVQQ